MTPIKRRKPSCRECEAAHGPRMLDEHGVQMLLDRTEQWGGNPHGHCSAVAPLDFGNLVLIRHTGLSGDGFAHDVEHGPAVPGWTRPPSRATARVVSPVSSSPHERPCPPETSPGSIAPAGNCQLSAPSATLRRTRRTRPSVTMTAAQTAGVVEDRRCDTGHTAHPTRASTWAERLTGGASRRWARDRRLRRRRRGGPPGLPG